MSQSGKKTVSVVGGTLWGNRGAEAMLVTTIGSIRREHPKCRFVVFSYYPERDRQLCQDDTIEFLNYRPLNVGLKVFPLAVLTWVFALFRIRLPDWMVGKEVAAIRQSDALCDVGGITFCDGREIFLLYNVLSILPAMLVRTPVFKMSQAMGPFKNPINRFWAKRILPRCEHVFSRGSITSENLKTLEHCSTKWSDATDVAFSYQSEFSLTDENPDRINAFVEQYQSASKESHQTIAIIPSSLVMKKNEQYAKQLSELAKDLVAAGNHVLLLPNATREGVEKTRNNDLVAIRAIIDHLSDDPELTPNISAVDFDVNTHGIRHLLSLADMLVTSRFHGMVASLAGTIPVVVIGWSHKYAEVLAQFASQELSIDHKSRDHSLTKQVMQVAAQVDMHRETLRRHLPDVVRSSERQLKVVSEFLGSSSSKAQQTDSTQSIPVVTSPIDSVSIPESVS